MINDTIENHPFIRKVEFKHAEILILGSFPCKRENSYGNWFYSGSGRNYFWDIMSHISQKEIISYEDKLHFCEKQKVAISDLL